MQPIEDKCKKEIKHLYLEEGAEYAFNPRTPNKVDNFKALGRKTNHIKETAMSVTLEMHIVYCESLVSEEEIKELNIRNYEEGKQKMVAKHQRLKKKREANRLKCEQFEEKSL